MTELAAAKFASSVKAKNVNTMSLMAIVQFSQPCVGIGTASNWHTAVCALAIAIGFECPFMAILCSARWDRS